MRAVELGLASSERRKRFSVAFWQRQRSAYVAAAKMTTPFQQAIWRPRVPRWKSRFQPAAPIGCAMEQMLEFPLCRGTGPSMTHKGRPRLE
jgi:hypothetical protein